jgi:hypothetical protein
VVGRGESEFHDLLYLWHKLGFDFLEWKSIKLMD